jgi:hypothetical protein
MKYSSSQFKQNIYQAYNEESSSEEEEEVDRELSRASEQTKRLMSTVVKYHSHVMRAFMAYVSIFSDVISTGIKADKIKATLSDNHVLYNVMRVIHIIDQITNILVDNKIIRKAEDPQVPILDLNKNNDAKVIHPFNAFLVRCLV